MNDSESILKSHNTMMISEKLHSMNISVQEDDIHFLDSVQSTIKKSNLAQESDIIVSLLKVNRYVVLASQAMVNGLHILYNQAYNSDRESS